MKQRNDFVSNSSSCSYIIPIDKVNHDPNKWLKNTLRIQSDNNKVMMVFGEFSENLILEESVFDNFKFVCTQLMYWICPELMSDGESKESKKKILRRISNDPNFIALDQAVKDHLGCDGIEFDSEDIRVLKDEDGDERCIFIPDCSLDHDSVYDGFEDMLKESGCSSIAELIWGVKEVRITWG